MTMVVEEYSRFSRWAARQPRIAKKHVKDERNNYHEYYSYEESKMFWLGYIQGYRTREKEEKV